MKEIEQIIQEMGRQVDEATRQLARLSNSQGLFTEGTVRPAVIQLFHERGFELTRIFSRMGYESDGDSMEIDLLGVGRGMAIIIEVKLRLEKADVDEVLLKLSRFLDIFPHFKGRRLYGAVAGMSIDQGVDRYSYKRGLFVLAQSGENMIILNDDKFKPREFSEMTTDD